MKRITNSYEGELNEVLQTLASDCGITIQADESVRAPNSTLDPNGKAGVAFTVAVNLENDTVESALTKIVGHYLWIKKQEGIYLVSEATPKDTFFSDFAETQLYHPQHQSAETIQALLSPTYQAYVSVDKMSGDKTSNTVIITAPPQRMPMIMKALATVDSRSRQFRVDAMITELNGGTSEDFGFSWNWRHFAVDTGLNASYASATSADVATLKALIGTNKASLRANPRVFALEGKETSLVVGTDTYLTIQTGVLNLQTSQIQVIKTGVTLKVTGFIGDDGYVTLVLHEEVGDFTTPVGGNPTVTVRKADTTVRVRWDETLVIGGLIQDTDTNVTTKIPILGDIPWIGQAFQQKTKARKRTDIVMMLTPHLTEDGAGEKGMAADLPLPPDGPKPPPLGGQTAPVVALHCGAEEYRDHDNRVWKADQYFVGGHQNRVGVQSIANTADPSLYASYRSGAGHFGYSIPAPNGKYLLKLGFVEFSCTEAGQRTFNVKVNGASAFSGLDVFAEAGGQGKALIKSVPVLITNGKLELNLEGVMDNPILSTIQLVPAP